MLETKTNHFNFKMVNFSPMYPLDTQTVVVT